MTDLQVKYQTLQETKRANQAKEELGKREAAIKQQEADTQEKKRIQDKWLQTTAQLEKAAADVSKFIPFVL